MVARYWKARTPDEENFIFGMKKNSSFMTELLPCGARWEYKGNLAHRYYRPASTACLLAECEPAFDRHWPVAAAGLRS